MSFSNGHDAGDMDLVVEVAAINVKIENVQKTHDIHSEILMKLSETQNILSQKLVALEIQRQNDYGVLQALQKSSSLQTKLLGLLITAIVGAAIKYFLHM